MFRRIASSTGLIPLAVLGWLLPAGPAAAQNEGYSVWQHRFDSGGGGRSGGGAGWRAWHYFTPPSNAYYGYAPAFSGGTPMTLSLPYYYAPGGAYYGYSPAVAAPVASSQGYSTSSHYAPGGASPVSEPATINVAVPADAEIRFEGVRTALNGPQRRFVSPPLEPGRDYSYDVQASWRQDGRDVTHTRRVTIHAGDVVHLTFPPG
jgi:uncharacterized protein (TIGR03000 family)